MIELGFNIQTLIVGIVILTSPLFYYAIKLLLDKLRIFRSPIINWIISFAITTVTYVLFILPLVIKLID